VVPAHLEFVDIAGLVKGAHDGEGLGNQFLANIRDVDAAVHVVRCFASPDVVHVGAEISPAHDIEILHTELMLADLDIVQRALKKCGRAPDKAQQERAGILQELAAPLEDGHMIRETKPTTAALRLASEIGLLTHRRELYVANLGENPDEQQEAWAREVEAIAVKSNSSCVRVYGRMEAELNDLQPDEQDMFRAELGLKDSTIHRLIHAGFSLLDLIRFYTTENDILQAWSIEKGNMAPAAAGQIHSDMQTGFISADVVSCEDLARTGSLRAAREEGCLRQEGKHYEVHDGDVFRFHFA
jgi:hypothetical protein